MAEKPYNLSKPPEQGTIEPREQSIGNTLNNDNPEKGSIGQRVEFNTDNFRRFVDDRSIKFIWQQGYICPCISKRTSSPSLTCPRCHGNGVAFMHPVESKGIVQSQQKGVRNMDIGLLDTGTAILTTQFEKRMGYRDRITIPDVYVPQDMVFYIDERRIKNGVNLMYDVKEVTFITSNDREMNENDYEIIDNKLYVNEEFTDSTVSMKVLMTLRYMVIDILKEGRYQYTEFQQPNTRFENLPQKVLLKREDVVVNPEPFILESNVDGEEIRKVEAKINDPLNYNENRNLGGFFNGDLNG